MQCLVTAPPPFARGQAGRPVREWRRRAGVSGVGPAAAAAVEEESDEDERERDAAADDERQPLRYGRSVSMMLKKKKS